MLRVQPNFTTAGFNNIQNQKPYTAKVNFNAKADTVSFGISAPRIKHSEELSGRTRGSFNKVIGQAAKQEDKIATSINRFLSNLQDTIAEKFGEGSLKVKVQCEFSPNGFTADGEKVTLESFKNKDGNKSLDRFKLVVRNEDDDVVKKFYIRNQKVSVYQEIEGYQPGDLNKSLSEYLSVFLPPKKAATK